MMTMNLTEIQKAIRRGLKSLEAPEPLRLSEWATKHFYLSAESSYVEGQWIAYPFQPAIMDAFSNDDIEVVVVKKSARVGYTKMLVAAIGYFAHHKRRNQAVWQPTDDDADEFVKVELDTMLRDVKAMQDVFPKGRGNDKRDTLSSKVFLGSRLYIKGGKAARSYRRISVDVAILDELDGFDQDIEKEGSPDKLAGKRTEGAVFPKQIMGSTPKLKGFSRTEAREEQCDLRFRFQVPCPSCGERHAIEFGGKDKRYGFKWINRDPATVGHVCPHCGVLYNQAEYLGVWHLGRWVAEDGTWIDEQSRFRSAEGDIIPAPRAIAFHIWTAYSPQATWEQIVRDYLAAVDKARAGDTSELKTFVNTTLGETWQEAVEQTEADALKQRAEKYALRTVPRGGLVLTAGVDVQSNRFECVVWATGRGEETWLVDYNVIDANPADEREWDEKLDPYLQLVFRHDGGQCLTIEAAAIDTGGHFTHQAYNFCRARARRKIYAVKGDSRQGQPVKGRSSLQDVNHRGQVIKRGVKLWLVGTDTAKDLIHGRLQVTQPGPGFVHFSHALSDEFYAQLTAEVRVLQRTATGEQYRWVKRRQRNEVLDCTVYAMFAAHSLDLHRYTERMWAKLEAAVNPPIGDLFELPPVVPANAATPIPAGASTAEARQAPKAESVKPAVHVTTVGPQQNRSRLAGLLNKG
jgi:phage terminase large subunit GpA-like protein